MCRRFFETDVTYLTTEFFLNILKKLFSKIYHCVAEKSTDEKEVTVPECERLYEAPVQDKLKKGIEGLKAKLAFQREMRDKDFSSLPQTEVSKFKVKLRKNNNYYVAKSKMLMHIRINEPNSKRLFKKFLKKMKSLELF